MASGEGDTPPLNGGEFLLHLLKNPPRQPPKNRDQLHPSPSQALTQDPAVAAAGAALPPFPSNSHDPNGCRPHFSHGPPFAPHDYFNPQNPNPNHNLGSLTRFTYAQNNLPVNHNFEDDVRKFGFHGRDQQEHKIVFGTLPSEIRVNGRVASVNSGRNLGQGMEFGGLSVQDRKTATEIRRLSDLEVELNRHPESNNCLRSFGDRVVERGGSSGRGSMLHHQGENYRLMERRPPPGFLSKESTIGPGSFGPNANAGKGFSGQLNHGSIASTAGNGKERVNYHFDDSTESRFNSGKLDVPAPPRANNLGSSSAIFSEERLVDSQGVNGKVEKIYKKHALDNKGLEEWFMDLVLKDQANEKNDGSQRPKSREKDYRSDKRGQWLLNQRMRNYKRQTECRNDINRLSSSWLATYKSLIPAEEEKAKQKQLLTLLDKHVMREWPSAQLFLYGSCANSFGFTKSDIDVCLAIEDADVNKSEVLLKLADMLQSENLENVQALTRARVPIVKLMDPATGISCDICVNNLLAVINTKLLRDYAEIDERLRHLAFIVKHWAKSRGVNETYQGTLSSYAYVLMCIHFLQRRRPPILPCLQEMKTTYEVTMDEVKCCFFDRVEELRGFGSRNGESIAQLVWGFFNYWAYWHDYTNDVISVRTGSTLSKSEKDWTRRIGNDRHLICIEDPFEVTHDLGRVVDKFTIRVLREEFERAAEILQHDPDPCVTLFQRYVPS